MTEQEFAHTRQSNQSNWPYKALNWILLYMQKINSSIQQLDFAITNYKSELTKNIFPPDLLTLFSMRSLLCFSQYLVHVSSLKP